MSTLQEKQLQFNPHLLRNEEIFRGASIYKIITIDMMKQIKARDKQIELAENIVDYLLRVFGFYGGKGLINHPSPNS